MGRRMLWVEIYELGGGRGEVCRRGEHRKGGRTGRGKNGAQGSGQATGGQ